MVGVTGSLQRPVRVENRKPEAICPFPETVMEVPEVHRPEAAWWIHVKYRLWTSVYSSVRKQWVALLLGHTWIASGNTNVNILRPESVATRAAACGWVVAT